MAQMEESLKTGSKRTLQVVRSRKTYMAAVLALAAVLIGACGLGIVWATGPQDVLIERANSSGKKPVRAAARAMSKTSRMLRMGALRMMSPGGALDGRR